MRIYRIAKKSHFEVLKDNKIPLTDEERQICLDRKAVWHHGPNGEESPAVWKSKGSDGKITYVTNTHRAFQDADTLEGAIEKYHSVIKDTAGVKNEIKIAQPHLKYVTDWHAIDWDNKSDEEIALEEKRNIKVVTKMRTVIAPHTKPPPENAIGYSPRGKGMWNKQMDVLFGLDEDVPVEQELERKLEDEENLQAKSKNWYRLAVSEAGFMDLKDKVRDLKGDLSSAKKDYKDLENRVKKIEKAMEELNIGQRRYWQERTTFTSLQRKIERFEKIEQEWKKYKEDLEEDIKNKIEKHTRASIGTLAPSK